MDREGRVGIPAKMSLTPSSGPNHQITHIEWSSDIKASQHIHVHVHVGMLVVNIVKYYMYMCMQVCQQVHV